MKQQKPLYFIDNVRGLAALAVAIFHYFAKRDNDFLDNTWFESAAFIGEYGVFVFFIVSGFIMPYTLYKKDYNITNYPRFLLKRLVRINPPYFLSILFIVLIVSVLSYRSGIDSGFNLKQILLHFFYLNGILDQPWVNVVYWTLAIEFQYYLCLGLLFPLFKTNPYLRMVLLMVLCIVPYVFYPTPTILESKHAWIGSYTQFFAFGMFCCFVYLKEINRLEIIGFGLFLAVLTYFHIVTLDALAVMVATTILFLLLNNYNKYLHFLGEISYSLYLVHNYTGLFLIAYARKKLDNHFLEFLTGMLALGIALGCAYVFYKIIEEPSKKWSKMIYD